MQFLHNNHWRPCIQPTLTHCHPLPLVTRPFPSRSPDHPLPPPFKVDLFLHGKPTGGLAGLARGILKDSNDGDAIVFLDSDGSASDSQRT